MRVLGIESSCDETAAAVVEDGKDILSNVVNSQIDIHKIYGGVVPEIAARSHIEVVDSVIDKALKDSGLSFNNIDAIAVTNGPGLIGSLLIGTLAARTIAEIKKIPLYSINHVEAHVYSNFVVKDQDGTLLRQNQPTFPMLSLIVSGGHTQLVLFKNHGDYKILGQTQDDAIGEAFDKAAKILGLPYPGGPAISDSALSGSPVYKLPIAKVSGAYDFSFSGLKTAFLRLVQKECGVNYDFPSFKLHELINDKQKNDFAASFQDTAANTLVKRLLKAYENYSPSSVVLAGGVAANQKLREKIKDELPCTLEYAPIKLCTDNAVMVASLGYFHAIYGERINPLDMRLYPSWSMKESEWL
jgi:N6-L-threonylcarbamoyladenine synthase